MVYSSCSHNLFKTSKWAKIHLILQSFKSCKKKIDNKIRPHKGLCKKNRSRRKCLITFVARERSLAIISLWFHNLFYSVVWVTWVYCKVCMIFVVAGRVIRPISFHVFKVNEVRKHEISGFRLIITTQISHTTEFIHSKSLSTSGQGKDCM